MTTEMICAGFGGQGVLTIGRFLAQAGMKEREECFWLPSYGLKCVVALLMFPLLFQMDPLSPIVSYPDVLVALNQPSLDKFGLWFVKVVSLSITQICVLVVVTEMMYN